MRCDTRLLLVAPIDVSAFALGQPTPMTLTMRIVAGLSGQRASAGIARSDHHGQATAVRYSDDHRVPGTGSRKRTTGAR